MLGTRLPTSGRLVIATAIASALTLAPSAAFAADPPGPGDDVIVRGDGPNVVDGQGGNDTISVGSGPNVIDGGDGDDDITAKGGTNVIDGGDGDDDIQVGDGGLVNQIDGGDGDDDIQAGDGTLLNQIDGGDGNDDIQVGDGSLLNVIDGGDGNDDIQVGDGSLLNQIDGGAGNDLLCVGGALVNIVRGGLGSDLGCARDDSATVDQGAESTLDLAANDQRLDDESSETTPLVYALVGPLPSGISAVIDAATGMLTYTAQQSCTLTYSVSREIADDPGSFITDFAKIFIDVRGSKGRCDDVEKTDSDVKSAAAIADVAVLPNTGAGDDPRLLVAGGLTALLTGGLVLGASRRRVAS